MASDRKWTFLVPVAVAAAALLAGATAEAKMEEHAATPRADAASVPDDHLTLQPVTPAGHTVLADHGSHRSHSSHRSHYSSR